MRPEVEFYQAAEAWVRENGYWSRIEEYADPDRPWNFLEEYANAVYTSYFSAAVVDKKWPQIAAATSGFDAAKVAVSSTASRDLRRAINNARKGKAIVDTAQRIAKNPRLYTREFLRGLPVEVVLPFLRDHPYMGPATSQLLARDLGFDTVKHDVHLGRAADCFGFENADELCAALSKFAKIKKGLVDLVIWYYCAKGPGKKELKRLGCGP